MDLQALTARALARAVADRRADPRDAVEAALSAIASRDGALHAFLHVDAPRARARAAALADRAARGEADGRLLGVPVAVKDNLCTADLPTTAGSRILEGYRPPYDATAVIRMVAEGAVMVGKTNLDEFGMGSSNEYSAFGPTANPLDPTRIPGGSSGGSAVAVAAGMAWLALGSDTGGSVRAPASACGIVGVRPTYGRVSRYGLVAFASSLDQVGPLARTVEDAALLLQVVAGPDPRDATTLQAPAPDFLARLDEGVQGLSLGLPEEYFGGRLDPEVDAAVRGAAGSLRARGARVAACSLPHTALAVAAYHVLAAAEASSNLARYDGVRYGVRAPSARLDDLVEESRTRGFGMEVKRRILLGTFVLREGYTGDVYRRALEARRLMAQDFRRAFASGFDALLVPTLPEPPFRLGERVEDPLRMHLFDACTAASSLAGIPAVSVPAPAKASGLPVGVQVLGPWGDEATCLRVARAVEALT